jgi:hypothetical protein
MELGSGGGTKTIGGVMGKLMMMMMEGFQCFFVSSLCLDRDWIGCNFG